MLIWFLASVEGFILLGFRDAAAELLSEIRRMIEILHYLKDPKLWESCCIPHNG